MDHEASATPATSPAALDWLPAYAAGLIDGEGYIGLVREAVSTRRATDSYYIQVIIGMTDRSALDLLSTRWGGVVRKTKRELKSGKSFYDWRLKGASAFPFLVAIYPYLCIKRERAQVVIEFQSQLEPYIMPKGRFGYAPISPDVVATREAFYQRYRALVGRTVPERHGC